MTDLKLEFVFEHGPADENQLDLYDGALSLEGMARAIAIATHAFINGEIRTHGEKARGARLYLLPPRPGTFVFSVGIWMAESVAGGLFYDFIKRSFQEAVGLAASDDEAVTPLQQRIEPTIGELPAVLESPLRQLHRTIRKHPEMSVTVIDPRGALLAIFDTNTAAALEPRIVELSEPVLGNVTRYNALSRWGKFYDRSQRRVISFLLGETVSERERSLITWSLHERNLNREGTLSLHASASVTPSGYIKRYDVRKVVQVAAS